MKTITVLSEYGWGDPIGTSLMFSRLIDRAEDVGLKWNMPADGASLSVVLRDLTPYGFTVWRAGWGDYGVTRRDEDTAYFSTARATESWARRIMRELKEVEV